MTQVNSVIRDILKKKEAGITSGTEAMLAILKELQRQVIWQIEKAATGSWDSYSLRTMLNAIERQIQDFEAQASKELSGNLDGMWAEGKSLVEKPVSSLGVYSGFGLSTASLQVLKEFAFHKVSGVSLDAWHKIKGELTLGVIGGKTPQEVANAIGRNLTDRSIFSSIGARAESITKTEMGRVFSKATQDRMEEASNYVQGLEKMWRHAGHPKVARPYHLALNGAHVPVNEPFLVGNTTMMFPRDPKAPAEQVINCGCDHVPYMAGWKVAA